MINKALSTSANEWGFQRGFSAFMYGIPSSHKRRCLVVLVPRRQDCVLVGIEIFLKTSLRKGNGKCREFPIDWHSVQDLPCHGDNSGSLGKGFTAIDIYPGLAGIHWPRYESTLRKAHTHVYEPCSNRCSKTSCPCIRSTPLPASRVGLDRTYFSQSIIQLVSFLNHYVNG